LDKKYPHNHIYPSQQQKHPEDTVLKVSTGISDGKLLCGKLRQACLNIGGIWLPQYPKKAIKLKLSWFNLTSTFLLYFQRLTVAFCINSEEF
jgi:hypothetical protein